MSNHWFIGRMAALMLLLSLSVAACIQPIAGSPSAMQADHRLAKLIGSWQVETTVVKQAATFPALLTFTSDGIVIADEPPSPFETSGHGNWVATGPDTANLTFLALIGSVEGPLSATLKVVGTLRYDANADTWDGPFAIQVTDAKGAEVLADHGTFKGTRIAIETANLAAQALKPSDKIGEMMVTQGPTPFDLNIPHYGAFCNANPMLDLGSTVAKPGKYIVECSVPPLPKMFIAFGLTARTAELLNAAWTASDSELYVNDQPIDQSAFGSLDADVPVTGMPGQKPNEVLNLKARVWNVILENLTPGQFTMRLVWHVSREVFDGDVTAPVGDYDVNYKITVDPSMAVNKGTPEPVSLVIEPVGIFDAFNAAVNAHDVDKALSFFADDAAVQFPNQPPPNLFKGSAEIRTWLENDAKDNIHVEVENTKTSGDTISATAKVAVDSLPPDLMLVGTVVVTVKNGKITSFTYTLNDETLAKLAALKSK
jgi:hypothetical protein